MIIDFVVRAGVVYALVVATKRYGIWGPADETQEIYNITTEKIEPYAEQARRKLKICAPRPPPEGSWRFSVVHYYNQVVIAFFEVLSAVPSFMQHGLEAMPGMVGSLVERVRMSYSDFMANRTKNEITISKKHIDELPLVQPIKPAPDSKCKCGQRTDPGLVPNDGTLSTYCNDKDCPKTQVPCKERFKDDFIYKPRMPKKPICDCPKCKKRQEEGWADKKRKCPQVPPVEQPPNNNHSAAKPKKKCKICPDPPPDAGDHPRECD
ncbi:uncharacterized protein LOC117892131 [Drosophila subobscura]|uniref:uncharacterized protein LOC117892131 n=1 Tax=Drosophila subobscura TaxID=7241 RepID=UPI00155AD24D|nr:uncharacterized protein LOC117892131 [Drosophila subobscura]